MASSGGFDGESQPGGLGDGDQRGETRIAMRRKRAVKTLPLDAGSFGDIGDALRLREVAQGN